MWKSKTRWYPSNEEKIEFGLLINLGGLAFQDVNLQVGNSHGHGDSVVPKQRIPIQPLPNVNPGLRKVRSLSPQADLEGH